MKSCRTDLLENHDFCGSIFVLERSRLETDDSGVPPITKEASLFLNKVVEEDFLDYSVLFLLSSYYEDYPTESHYPVKA